MRVQRPTQKTQDRQFFPSFKVIAHEKLLLLLFSIRLFLFCQLIFTCFVLFVLQKRFFKKI